MSPSELRSKLQGVIGFPVTPFNADLSLDLGGFRRNLRAMLAHPPAAIVAAGGTGELYSLSPAEHLAVVRAAVEEVQRRGTGDRRRRVQRTDRCRPRAAGGRRRGEWHPGFPALLPGGRRRGVAAVLPGRSGARPASGLLIYSRDWFHPSAALVERLASIPNLIAWKDGQGDIRRLQILRSQVGDRLHWIGGAGDDLVPAYYGTGIRAFTSSVANVVAEGRAPAARHRLARRCRRPRSADVHLRRCRSTCCARSAAATKSR